MAAVVQTPLAGGFDVATAAQVRELMRGLAEEKQKRQVLEQALKMLWTEVTVRDVPKHLLLDRRH
jgi:hypothetical protein